MAKIDTDKTVKATSETSKNNKIKIKPVTSRMEKTHFPIKNPKSRTNQVRLKTREARLEMPRRKLTSIKAVKAKSQSSKAGQKILRALNSLAKVKNLMWYVLLLLTIYIKRTHGALFMPIAHPMFMPIAASPLAMNPDLIMQLHPGLQGSNRSAESNISTTTDVSPSRDTPTYSGSSVEVPSYLPMLFMVGIMAAVMTGAAAVIHRLIRHCTTPTSPPTYENLEEDIESQGDQMRTILAKAAHLRSPWERLAVDKWERLTFDRWVTRQ